MYTGTLINDLMAMVERAEQTARLRSIVDEMELEQLFDSPVLRTSEPVFAGAA
jgi:hypothetical protein